MCRLYYEEKGEAGNPCKIIKETPDSCFHSLHTHTLTESTRWPRSPTSPLTRAQCDFITSGLIVFAASQCALVETVAWGRLEETEDGNGGGDAGQRGCQSFYSLAFKKLSIAHHCISPSAGLRAWLHWENNLQPPHRCANKPHRHHVHWYLQYRLVVDVHQLMLVCAFYSGEVW